MSRLFSILFISLILVLQSLSTQAQTTWFSGLSTTTTNTTAAFSWNTAAPATTQIRYGVTTNYGSHSNLDATLSTAHSVNITGLASGTVYHLRLLARDAEPLVVTSLDYTFTTQGGPIAVSVSPANGTIASGASQQFSAQVTNATNTAVTWSTTAGSITAGGMYTAPVVASDQQASITATSVADASKSATAKLTIKAPIQHSVSLKWQASPSSNIVSYSTYRSGTKGGPYGLIASAIQGLGYSDTTVQAGTAYYYVVTATNDLGEESADSNEVKAAVPSP